MTDNIVCNAAIVILNDVEYYVDRASEDLKAGLTADAKRHIARAKWHVRQLEYLFTGEDDGK